MAETTRPIRSPVAPRPTLPGGGGTRGRSARRRLTRAAREATGPDYHLSTVAGDMASSSPERKLVAVTPTGLIGGAEIVLVRLLDAARCAGWTVDAAVPDGALADQFTAKVKSVLESWSEEVL